MTNSDRLQEIREEIQKERQRYSSHPTMLMLDALLQLVTEQQREIDRLNASHEAIFGDHGGIDQ